MISCGGSHSLAIKADGTLWAWGDNVQGQLGDGTIIQRTSPIQIGSSTDWSMIRCGDFHSLAIKTDGTLWAWGRNTYGQLGDGSTIQRTSPTKIGSSNFWLKIGGGAAHSIAISGVVLNSWGYNNKGQLGDGTTTQRTSPSIIGRRQYIVTSAVAGTGIALSNEIGEVIITNTGVQTFNGLAGALQGVSAAVAGTGISVSGATGSVTITNTGVQTFNGLAGAVTGVTVGGTNTFTALNTFQGGAAIYGIVSTGITAPTIASATTITPTKAITFISGSAAIQAIIPPSGISTAAGGQITLIPTGAFTTTTAGNIALASTAVQYKAMIMTYDGGTTKWYPSY